MHNKEDLCLDESLNEVAVQTKPAEEIIEVNQVLGVPVVKEASNLVYIDPWGIPQF
jgi:hypothetical protein